MAERFDRWRRDYKDGSEVREKRRNSIGDERFYRRRIDSTGVGEIL